MAKRSKLPPNHPRRIWSELDRARKNYLSAKAKAADDGMYAMRPTAYQIARSAMERAERIYNEKRARWAAAGKPDREGKRTSKRVRHAASEQATAIGRAGSEPPSDPGSISPPSVQSETSTTAAVNDGAAADSQEVH